MALVLVLSLGLVSSQAATAASVAPTTEAPEVSSQAEVSPEMIKEGLKELKASSVPRTVVTTASEVRTTYLIPGSYQFTVVEPVSDRPQPRLGGGADAIGVYILFNQFDQDAIISGGGFLLGAAICAIPGVGTLACVGVGALLTAAALYLSYNGKCRDNKQLKAYVFVPERNSCV